MCTTPLQFNKVQTARSVLPQWEEEYSYDASFDAQSHGCMAS